MHNRFGPTLLTSSINMFPCYCHSYTRNMHTCMHKYACIPRALITHYISQLVSDLTNSPTIPISSPYSPISFIFYFSLQTPINSHIHHTRSHPHERAQMCTHAHTHTHCSSSCSLVGHARVWVREQQSPGLPGSSVK